MGTRCGIRVARIDFSDPQGSKGAADRLAASCKFHIRAYINEGHDVCTANDMKRALISHGGLDGVQVVSMDTISEKQDMTQTMAGITNSTTLSLLQQIPLLVGVHVVSVLAM